MGLIIPQMAKNTKEQQKKDQKTDKKLIRNGPKYH